MKELHRKTRLPYGTMWIISFGGCRLASIMSIFIRVRTRVGTSIHESCIIIGMHRGFCSTRPHALCSKFYYMLVVVACTPLLMVLAKDIPRANSPNTAGQCGGPDLSFPPPVLASCTEPIPQGIVDLRGTYITDVGPLQLTERVEQCGKRFVVSAITAPGYW